MKRETAKIVPKFLNFEQKQRRMYRDQEMLTTFKNNPYLLNKVITGDESWKCSEEKFLEVWKYPEETKKSTKNSVKTEGFTLI